MSTTWHPLIGITCYSDDPVSRYNKQHLNLTKASRTCISDGQTESGKFYYITEYGTWSKLYDTEQERNQAREEYWEDIARQQDWEGM